MLFYKIQAKHEMAIPQTTEEKTAQSKEIYAAFQKYNQNTDGAYYFVSEIEKESVVGGIVVFDEKHKSQLISFPWSIINFSVFEEHAAEVTSEDFGVMFNIAINSELAENFRNNKQLRAKMNLFPPHHISDGMLPDEDFYEEEISEEFVDVATSQQSAKDNLWCDNLVEEYNRIASSNTTQFVGHPVHYVFASDDFYGRQEQAQKLVSALYAKGRLNSRRFCKISLSHVGERETKYLNSLYECYCGGTIMICYRHEARKDAGMSDLAQEVLYKITALIKKHANNVLTIFCFPLSCSKEKDIFYSELPNLSFVEFRDDAVNFSQARAYLERKVIANDVQPNDELFCGLDADKTYRAVELDKVFEDWYSDYLRKDVYPQYAFCPKAGGSVLQEDVKGNAYYKLMDLIGLGEAKNVITRVINYYKAQKAFGEMGFGKDTVAMHMVFTGNPGTAKTTVARLFADIMRENGVLSSGHLVEVGRGDIVGKYVGQTAPLVQKAFRRAKGGVLFIDEAYSLVDDRDGMYGDEAINTIVQEMENHREDTCVIFAGYPNKMEAFINKNPGLRSRIAFNVPFADYSVEELVEITKYMCNKKDIILDESAITKIATVFNHAKGGKDFGNGRFVRNMLEKARMSQATRLVECGFDSITKKMVQTLTAEDIDDYVASQPTRKIGF